MKLLTNPVMLVLYDPVARTQITADALAYDLGAVLMQQNEEDSDLLHLPLEH